MGWKAGNQHEEKKEDKRGNGNFDVGTKHKDIYHTDEQGERDRPHHEDMKITYDSEKKDTSDIKKK